LKRLAIKVLTLARSGSALQKSLGFFPVDLERRPDWMLNPSLEGFQTEDAEKALRDVLAHRLWIDQRKGWRYTNPNLEQLWSNPHRLSRP